MMTAAGRRSAIGFLLRLCVVLVWPVLTAGSCVADLPDLRQREPLTLVGADGTPHEVKVEVMRTDDELWRGLRGRQHMAADQGMLFDLGGVRSASFTMSDTLIPLDMLFVGPDGEIVSITEKTQPGDPGPFTSERPVRAVLELNAGTAARLHVAAGAHVRHELFKNAGRR